MKSLINRVILTGRLTKDVELIYTQNGKAKAKFTVAVNRTFANQSGERDADFINVQVWGKTAQVCADYLSKGSLVGIDGRLQTGSFEGQDGSRVYFTVVIAESVQFLEPKENRGNQQQQQSDPYHQNNNQQQSPGW